jgi:hypothetical protein
LYSPVKLEMYTWAYFNIPIVYISSAVVVNAILPGIYLSGYESRSLKHKNSVFYVLSCVIAHGMLDSTSDNVSYFLSGIFFMLNKLWVALIFFLFMNITHLDVSNWDKSLPGKH